jgi:hypothetical protein
MSPRTAVGKRDYNLAFTPELLLAGKITAAAEDRALSELLRHLLIEYIERKGPAEAQEIYATARGVPHGTRIDRFGKLKTLSVQMPALLADAAKAEAIREERSLHSLVRRALERYLTDCKVPIVAEMTVADESQLDLEEEIEKVNGGNENRENDEYGELR